MITPAIVVVTYNRPKSVLRLLQSLNDAEYGENRPTLVISVDFSGDTSTQELAEKFEWKHGEKRIIVHKKNLGLRAHILSAGDLSEEYGSVIVLEDDLYVSKYFYGFTQNAAKYYIDDQAIVGVSLFNHCYNETSGTEFRPIEDGNDVYFMQLPSSWGQYWNKEQWRNFKIWYELAQNQPFEDNVAMPPNVYTWPESSWKKYFIKYMIVQNKYFVYPRASHTTNFMEIGTHLNKRGTKLQVPLLEKNIYPWRFIKCDDSFAIYDAFCELLGQKMALLKNKPECLDWEIDLYGRKDLRKVEKKYVLTSKPVLKYIQSFGSDLRPHEMNVIKDLEGGKFRLVQTEEVILPKETSKFKNKMSKIWSLLKQIGLLIIR